MSFFNATGDNSEQKRKFHSENSLAYVGYIT
jgi:hypothetical protein